MSVGRCQMSDAQWVVSSWLWISDGVTQVVLQPRKWVSTPQESMKTEKRSKARVRHGASQLGGVSLKSVMICICPEPKELPAVELLVLKPGELQEVVRSP